VKIHCSKGTYVRSLAADMGEALGVGAHVAALHRQKAGAFDNDDAVDLNALEQERGESKAEVLDKHLLPIDAPVSSLAEININEESAYYFGKGNPVMDLGVYQIGDEGDTVRVFEESGRFLGLAQITDDGCLAPKRLVVY